MSFSKEYEAFAGLVDGNIIASIPVFSRKYFLYKLFDLEPLVKTAFISAEFVILETSFTTTFDIELSDEPEMSQDFITSHKAILLFKIKFLFSSILFGSSTFSKVETTFQNLLYLYE